MSRASGALIRVTDPPITRRLRAGFREAYINPVGLLDEETMLARDEEILRAAEEWRKSGRGVALATVVETWGSAPRPVGANLVIDHDGNFLGSVSGGCVEGAVVAEAVDVIQSGKPKILEFGVADETAWQVGLSCGGTIRVLVEKVE
jgi:XdhC and CoxI family